MNRIVRLRHNEDGYVLSFVLILVLMVSIVVVPLLVFMASGMRSAQRHQEWTSQFYAADAGVEDAAHKVQNQHDDLPEYGDDPWVYTIQDVNGCEVEVSIEAVWILDGLETPIYGTVPHDELAVVSHVVEMGEDGGTFRIEMTYDGSLDGNLKLDKVGAWLPAGFTYITDSASGITTHEDVPDNPTASSFRGGTALEWEFTTPEGVLFEDLPPPGGGEGGSFEYPLRRLLYFDFTPALDPSGEFSWIRTTRHDIYLSWDVDSDLYAVSSTAVHQETDEDVALQAFVGSSEIYEELSEAYGDYRAIGSSLMEDQNSNLRRETLLYRAEDTTATLSDIPEGASIELAYLYWSAWRRYPVDITDYEEEELVELAEEVDVARLGTKQSGGTWIDIDVDADRVQILPNTNSDGSGHGWAFSCRADVTDLVAALDSPSCSYKVRRIDGIDDEYGLWYGQYRGYYWATDDEWSYAGWSLVVVYSHQDENAHQMYLYDDFFYMEMYQNVYLDAIEGFLVPELDPGDEGARLTVFVGEGDDAYNSDYLRFEGHLLPHEDDPYDGVNPQDDVWNGKSSGLDGEFIDGVDIDTFDATPYVTPGQTEAEVLLGTWVDSWNLIYVILSFRTDPSTDPGVLPVSILSYQYD